MEEQSIDIIKELVIELLRAVEGSELDIFVFVCILGMLLAGYKQKFKSSAGFMLMISGVVIIRVLVRILFAGELGLP